MRGESRLVNAIATVIAIEIEIGNEIGKGTGIESAPRKKPLKSRLFRIEIKQQHCQSAVLAEAAAAVGKVAVVVDPSVISGQI
jgi:hypothetical protein